MSNVNALSPGEEKSARANGPGGKILFALTGSIACYKACFTISQLVQKGFEIQTVASEGALNFIGASTLEGLTSRPVFSDVFQTGRQMDHIHLARWADLILVCPATANTLNRLAAGLSDDSIGALFLSNNFRKPCWLAPAMNLEMWKHPATQRSVGLLKEWGVRFLGPEAGAMACGEEGLGRLIDPDKLVIEVLDFFNREPK